MSAVVGSIKKLVIDGTTYDVMQDAKASYNPSEFEVEEQPTTGDTLMAMKRRVPIMEGIDLGLTPKTLESLRAKADSTAEKTLAITFADGSVYRAKGRISIDKWESDTGKCTVKLIPSGAWSPFLAD